MMRKGMLVEEVMRRDFVVADTDKPITHVLRSMRRTDADGFLVVEGGKLIGLATYWDLMVRLGSLRVREVNVSSLFASSVMEPVRTTLTPKSTIVDAARTMVEDPNHMIPIIDSGEVVGIIEPRDIAKALLNDEVPAINVSLRNAPTVNISDRIVHARRLMMNSMSRSLAVLSDGVVVGVVSDDQMVDAYVNLVLGVPMEKQKAHVRRILVADLGPRHVKASLEATVADVAKLIVEKPVKGVPLVGAAGELMGFVSIFELAKFIVAQTSSQ
ncbi:MAG: CBS domain-containing protein [Candidatus Nezhaarchaeota archaeon]|nr:CBS domain-containing protein [Candidatus Nezhaarchaeota archaeon]MCX8141180.1 CBS domain-containing protein [Candidatus Nezhaarchaeota archaeon]